MNKVFFRLLIFLMTVSLLGIILVQVYWFNTSLENNQEQFKFHVLQVLSNVSTKLQKQEQYNFYNKYNKLKDSIGTNPKNSDFLEYGYYQRNAKTNQTIIYSNSIIAEDYNLSNPFFDKKNDSLKIKTFKANRKTEIFNNNSFDKSSIQNQVNPDITINKSGKINKLENLNFEIAYKDIAATYPIEDRVTAEQIQKILKNDLIAFGVNTPFEFSVYSNGLATKIKSEQFEYDKNKTYSIPIFIDNEGKSKHNLFLTFPQVKKFLFSDIVEISLLSIIFTFIIIIAYANALHQIIKQRQISEIKTDFINNMTHEFKTPIATINLALDAIKNPKVIDDKEKIFRYLQMIRDENKRMHAQVENVLRISKLEKKELDINKEPLNIEEIISDAIEHVALIIEDRNGIINKNFSANRKTVLLSDVHFTNVMVNILDNAIKYSPNNPIIEVFTENLKDFIIIKVKDQGAGMSKSAQKKIFEKFYREHTGDVHNVKGHGLGLSYVKRIVEDHNGEVFVESDKGKGSTFIVKLPLIN